VKVAWRATLAPLRSPAFLRIWSAGSIANFGNLIQTVGASWLMTLLATSSDSVAFVQTAISLPLMLLALPSGATADIYDKRVLMLLAQGAMLATSLVLAAMAILDRLTPPSLLIFMFIISCGMCVYAPAWLSSVAEQVPRDDLPAAVALNSLSFNLARTAGPALGGVIVALGGAAATFVVGALGSLSLIVALATWRRPKQLSNLPPETIVEAMGAGLRYVSRAPALRAVLSRTFAAGIGCSALWSMMPLIVRDRLGGGALMYGILFTAFGAGAVLSALTSTTIRNALGNERLVQVTTIGFAIAAAVSGSSTWVVPTIFAFLIGGASWVLLFSTFNVTVQLLSPRWVAGRTLAIYQMVTFGGLSLGSFLWGELADKVSLPGSLAASAAALVLSLLLNICARMPPHTEGAGLETSRIQSSLAPTVKKPSLNGRILTTVTYCVAQEDGDAFVNAMHDLRRIRLRDGARNWMLVQDLSEPEMWIERFQSPSWVQHLRQHHRFTMADQDIEARALAFHRGSEPPRNQLFIERQPNDGARAMAALDAREKVSF
jgi:MFS family permease